MESDRNSFRCFTKTTHLPHEPCDFQAACESGLYDYELIGTGLINWRVTYHKACLPDRLFSLIGSCYFAGYLAGSALFMPLSDRVGHKQIVLSQGPFCRCSSPGSFSRRRSSRCSSRSPSSWGSSSP